MYKSKRKQKEELYQELYVTDRLDPYFSGLFKGKYWVNAKEKRAEYLEEIDYDHLINIIKKAIRSNDHIPKEIRAEYEFRREVANPIEKKFNEFYQDKMSSVEARIGDSENAVPHRKCTKAQLQQFIIDCARDAINLSKNENYEIHQAYKIIGKRSHETN